MLKVNDVVKKSIKVCCLLTMNSLLVLGNIFTSSVSCGMQVIQHVLVVDDVNDTGYLEAHTAGNEKGHNYQIRKLPLFALVLVTLCDWKEASSKCSEMAWLLAMNICFLATVSGAEAVLLPFAIYSWSKVLNISNALANVNFLKYFQPCLWCKIHSQQI